MIKPRNKYGAVRTFYDGRWFASKGEAECYALFKMMERAGEIKNIECQVVTPLVAGITHKTDFKYFDNRLDQTVYAEFKGLEDQRWRDIKKLWKHAGPGILRVYKGKGLRISMTDEILPEPPKGQHKIAISAQD